MFIGHFAIAFLLLWLFPGVNPLVPLIGVSFPDLLWPVLVWTKVERVAIPSDTALQRSVEFLHYPFSHSLVVGTSIAGVVGVTLAVTVNPLSGVVFVLAAASHWVLDAVVHLKDLPLLGFGHNRKVGLGLWRWGAIAFIVEYLLYAGVSVFVVPPNLLGGALLLGAVFHVLNSNSFFGFTKKNPFGGHPASYAAFAFAGFWLFILFASGTL